MFGRTVIVNGKEFFVSCSPDTPNSEILKRAAKIAEAEEQRKTWRVAR